MKKLNLHLFYEKTGRSKASQVPLWKPILWALGAIIAILGFIFFSPFEIYNKLSDGTLSDLRAQNRVIRQNVNSLKADNDSAELYLSRTKSHQDSIYKIGGIDVVPLSAAADSLHKAERTEALFNTYKIYSIFRDSLLKHADLAESIPVLHPIKKHSVITNHFGMIHDHFTDQILPHRGVDFFAEEGDTVMATGAGKIIEVRVHQGFGQTVKIQHSSHIRTFYAHLDKALVKQGESVKRGDPIAIAGRSGRTAGSVLHYEIRIDGESVNPEDYFIVP
ncbi:MAG: M23 family metallopeptidase [Fibrobacter sp.]|nr:M23 family metallopeptidase [Fibrobacter sp.]